MPPKYTHRESAIRHVHAGDRFGHWVLLAEPEYDGGRHYAPCLCDCGTQKRKNVHELLRGASLRCRNCAPVNTRSHGEAKSAEFKAWQTMRQRCSNPHNASYSRYGGRGIRVCERWARFEHFLADMGRRPSAKHSLDRIDNDGDYEPENCRWADASMQGNNTSVNVHLEFGGRTMTLAQWAKEVPIPLGTLARRIRAGWTVERALTEPLCSSHPWKNRRDRPTR